MNPGGQYTEGSGTPKVLELLAPARDADTGIGAVNAGADAVYIGGPLFGARKAAGNSITEIHRLCEYAHRFGVRVFVTFNVSVCDNELDTLHTLMLEAQEAGADAFIVRDSRIFGWCDITRPLHASTQCAIRTVDDAKRCESLGSDRIVLERQLPLDTVREICSAVNAEVEFFVHGAICVGYSGECRLSEFLDGRSADRGDCIQACRSRYDLVNEKGEVLCRNKALLSLRDYRLIDRLEDLADAGVCSFKIEGRLKSESYVRNVVREYDLALNRLVAGNPGKYRRASFGRVRKGFTPDTGKTFNRGYTSLFLDGKRGKWSSMDAPKSAGEEIGEIVRVNRTGNGRCELKIKTVSPDIKLENGDGFTFSDRAGGITGFRGDICRGDTVICRYAEGLRPGLRLRRNLSAAFEKKMDRNPCIRMMDVTTSVRITPDRTLEMYGECENGTSCHVSGDFSSAGIAENPERMKSMIYAQVEKSSGEYDFHISSLDVGNAGMPLIRAAEINALRRKMAEELSAVPYRFESRRQACNSLPAAATSGKEAGVQPLLRSKYCIRYELGICPKQQKGSENGRLYLLNNGRRLELRFDCNRCEMTVYAVKPERR